MQAFQRNKHLFHYFVTRQTTNYGMGNVEISQNVELSGVTDETVLNYILLVDAKSLVDYKRRKNTKK